MSKFYLIQNSFRSGEFGPRLLGRTDTKEYQESCSEITNFTSLVQGGLTRRMGSKYVYSSLSKPHILPFVFSKTEGFAILINHDGTNPTVIDKDGDLQKVILSKKVMAGKDMSSWGDWVKDINPNGWQHTQLGDVIILVHGESTVPPVVISRKDDPEEGQIFFFEWYLEADEFVDQDRTKALRWTYKPINIKDIWLQTGTVSDLIFHNITARVSQSSTADTIDNFWDVGDVGTLIRIAPYNGIDNPTAIEYLWEVVEVINPVKNKSATAKCKIIYPDAYPPSIPNPSLSQYMSKDWRKAYWSDFSGWPKSVTGFEQRLFFGGNNAAPDTLWGSYTGNIYHMMRERFEQDKNATDKTGDLTRLNYFGTETPADPLELIPAAAEVNKIQWIHGGAALMVGTIGAEYILTGGAQGLASDNLNFRRQTAVGSSAIQTASLKNSIYFVARTGRRLHDLITDPADLVSETRDLNTLNEDIISHQSTNLEEIVSVSSQVATNTIWCQTSADALIGFTMNDASGVSAWHRHVIADAEGREAKVTSIGVIPNESGSFDDLWLVAVRLGLGIKLLSTDAGQAGLDATPETSGLTIINYPTESVPPFDNNLAYPVVSRRVVAKFPAGSDVTTLANNYFNIDDGTSWDIWFKDTFSPGLQPANTGKFVVTVDITTDPANPSTKEDIVAAASEKLNTVYSKFNLEADAVGVTATPAQPVGAQQEHFVVDITEGTSSEKMTASIEIVPGSSTEFSLVQDIIDNVEYIYLTIPGPTDYYFYFGADPSVPGTGINVDISGGIGIENQHEYVLEQLKIEINNLALTTTGDVIRFDTRSGYETIERIGENFSNDQLFNDSPNEADKPYYSDSSIRATVAPAATSIGGFNHLVGDTVEVLADGHYVGAKIVNPDGTIDLDAAAEEVIAGYPYTSIVKTFPIEAGADWGSTVGVIQRLDKATVIFYKTFGAKIGVNIEQLEEMEFLPDDYAIGQQLPLFTGRQQVYLPASPEDLQFVIIEQSRPLPCTVIAIAMRGRTYDSAQ